MEKGLSLLSVSPLILSAVLGIFLALYISRKRPVPGSRALMALILGASVWAVGYALEFLSPDLESKIFWAKFQYFGIATIPLLWLIFADRQMGMPEWMASWSRYLWLLAFIPLLTLILVWTNELHGLVWRSVHLQPIGPVDMLGIEHGPWFWFYWMYSYTVLLIGSLWLVRGLMGTNRLRRWQIVMVLVAIAIPWIANLVYITPLNPIEHFDWTPFAFILAGLFFTIGLYSFRFANILPIAQRTVFAGLTDCVVVLDPNGIIEDLNPAARKKLVKSNAEPVGMPLAQLAPTLASQMEQAGLDSEFSFEMVQGEAPEMRFYDVHVTPLMGTSSHPVGRLVVRHEITYLKQEQKRLEQAVADRTEDLRRTMEQIEQSHQQLSALTIRLQQVQESERRQIASDLHDCIGQNLTGLSLNLQIIDNELYPGCSDAIHSRLQDSLKLVEETTRHVRSVMVDLHPPVLDEFGLMSALEWYGVNFAQRTGIAVQVVGGGIETYLPREDELVLFRLVQEALNNVAKHARATHVEISLEACQAATILMIQDDGQGFDPQAVDALGDEPHWGLLTIEQRATSIGGQLAINSAPGQGTLISVVIQRDENDD